MNTDTYGRHHWDGMVSALRRPAFWQQVYSRTVVTGYGLHRPHANQGILCGDGGCSFQGRMTGRTFVSRFGDKIRTSPDLLTSMFGSDPHSELAKIGVRG